jgi:cobalt-zinc-cadmium efflux system protein
MSDNHHHHHDHPHDHPHGAGHVHAPASFGKAFTIGIVLNTAFVVIEAVYGITSNSVALLADAGHNLSDVLGLVVAWGASVLSQRAPSSRYTYGLRGTSILAALFNAIFLLVSVGAIGWEAILRLFEPAAVEGKTVMAVAGVGILINGFTALLFASGRKGDINIRGAFLHMAADAAISAGVVIAALVLLITGWQWLDPVVSLAISAIIIWATWGLLRDSVAMSLAAVPGRINSAEVQKFLERQPGVSGVHDLHIWPMSTTEIALTAHLVMEGGCPGDEFLMAVGDKLRHDHGIGHVTLQVEREGSLCPQRPAHVV